MKITDFELNIKSILDVQKGKIPPSSPSCTNRHSDCFVYVLSGQAEYTFENKSYCAQTGNVIYLAKGSSYLINVTDENYTFIFIDFFFENTKHTVFDNAIYKSKGVSALENSFEKLYLLWKMGNFSEKIYCKSLIFRIYSEIVKSTFAQYVSNDRRKQVECIAEYISEHLSDSNLNITMLSQMCNISEVHFRRIFACIYHTSPIKFITSLRIKKAKELLISEQNSIAEISEQCGFQNPYYFSKIFKAETHITPSDFRKFYKTNH